MQQEAVRHRAPDVRGVAARLLDDGHALLMALALELLHRDVLQEHGVPEPVAQRLGLHAGVVTNAGGLALRAEGGRVQRLEAVDLVEQRLGLVEALQALGGDTPRLPRLLRPLLADEPPH